MASAPVIPGGPIIICNSVHVAESRITTLKPNVLTFDEGNHVRDRLSYSVELDAQGKYTFSILDKVKRQRPIPLSVTGI